VLEPLIHYRAEAVIVYPIVEEALGAPGSTRALSRDLFALGALAEELGFLHEQVRRHGLGPDRAVALRRVLYELHAIARLHCAKEEELYFPVLDGLVDSERTAAAARDVRKAAEGIRPPFTRGGTARPGTHG